MLGSKSDFFHSDEDILIKTRNFMIYFLKMHKTKKGVINLYLEAYEYFILNPNEFDGATLSKDIKVIPNLDIWAMLHDYLYIKYNIAVNWKLKYYGDVIYALEMERLGISYGTTWGRFILLVLSQIIFTPYQLLKGKRMDSEQKSGFMNIIKKFKN